MTDVGRAAELAGIAAPATICGRPAAWFGRCSTLDAEAWIFPGGVSIDGVGGAGVTPLRMRDRYRERAGW